MSNTSEFYKISCIDKNNQCNFIQPIDTKLDMSGINVNTGSIYNQNEQDKVSQTFTRICSQFDGKKEKCCDPLEYRYKASESDLLKIPKVNVNRDNLNNITSIEICKDPKTCSSDDNTKQWIQPSPYLLCKIGDNELEEKKNNVFETKNLYPDCYSDDRQCNSNKYITINHLTSKIINKESYDYYDDSRLVSYIKEDNLTQIKLYYEKPLNQRPDINKKLSHDDASNTLLHKACLENAVKIVRYLITNQADINIRNYYGESPLLCAIKVNNIQIVSFLLNQNADTTIRNNIGQNVLSYSIMYSDLAMLTLLYNNQGDINNVDNDGNTLLHLIVLHTVNKNENENENENENKNTHKNTNKKDMLIFCLERGVNIDLKNNKGKTALELAEEIQSKTTEEYQDQLNQKFFLSPILEKFEDEIINKKKELSEIITILRHADFKQKPHIYKQKFIENVPKASIVEVKRWGCAGGNSSGLEDTLDKCHSVNGQWYEYYDSQNHNNNNNNNNTNNNNKSETFTETNDYNLKPSQMTKIQVSQPEEDDDKLWYIYDKNKPSTFIKINYVENNSELLKDINENHLYKPKISQLTPLKENIALSHDEIMTLTTKPPNSLPTTKPPNSLPTKSSNDNNNNDNNEQKKNAYPVEINDTIENMENQYNSNHKTYIIIVMFIILFLMIFFKYRNTF